ncbi:unnamed protein product, partial [Oppiella nova]
MNSFLMATKLRIGSVATKTVRQLLTANAYHSCRRPQHQMQRCLSIMASKQSPIGRQTDTATAADIKQKELSLRREMVQKITATGPMTVAEYQQMVLTHPISGFYMKDDVFGAKGHFTTSPEISQIFGELIAVWLLNEWQRYGCPKPLRVVELGPGRGTLAADVGRVLSQFSHSKDVTSLHLIELSPHLTQIQEQNICGTVSLIERNESEKDFRHSALTQTGLPITWYRSMDQIGSKP